MAAMSIRSRAAQGGGRCRRAENAAARTRPAMLNQGASSMAAMLNQARTRPTAMLNQGA